MGPECSFQRVSVTTTGRLVWHVTRRLASATVCTTLPASCVRGARRDSTITPTVKVHRIVGIYLIKYFFMVGNSVKALNLRGTKFCGLTIMDMLVDSRICGFQIIWNICFITKVNKYFIGILISGLSYPWNTRNWMSHEEKWFYSKVILSVTLHKDTTFVGLSFLSYVKLLQIDFNF